MKLNERKRKQAMRNILLMSRWGSAGFVPLETVEKNASGLLCDEPGTCSLYTLNWWCVWVVYCWLNNITWTRGFTTGLGGSCLGNSGIVDGEADPSQVRDGWLKAEVWSANNLLKRFLCVLCKYICLCKWVHVQFKHQLALEPFETTFS